MSENKSKLSINVSVTDTELFRTLVDYTGKLIEILSDYALSEKDAQELNAISKDFFELNREAK